MPDYIYLLENRLRASQLQALRHVREVAREAQTTVFLTGDAVRDLTQGHHVRSLEVTVQGNALKLKKPLEKLGAVVWGEDDATRTLYLYFPGSVQLDLTSARTTEFPRPGKAVIHWAGILDDLRRRDFTTNAMAISLNEGSYGLLMDPLNGVADIESRHLRLVSNYGFLEDPALLIRSTRLLTRLGWEFEERTGLRYDNAKGEGVIEYLSEFSRREELEQIAHEEDALKVLQALDEQGWMKVLFPAWTAAKADVDKLNALHDFSAELMMQGVHADMSAAQLQLLTAKLSGKDIAALKQQLLRPGFVAEWESLDQQAADFAKVLLSKENQKPSATFKLFHSYDAEAILWLGFTSRQQSVKDRYNLFLREWPQVRQQQIPYALMQEMRITPELPGYAALVDAIFLELIDGNLATTEALKVYLEPHSPPPPPAPIRIKKQRGKAGRRAADEDEERARRVSDDEDEDDLGLDADDHDDHDDLDLGADDEHEPEPEPEAAPAPKAVAKKVKPEPEAKKTEPQKPEPKKPEPKPVVKKAAPAPKKPEPKPVAKKAPAAPIKAAKKVAAPAKKAVAKPAPKPATKKTSAKPIAKKPAAKPAKKPVAAKPVAKKAAAPAKKAVIKKAVKPVVKKATKPAAKPKPVAKPAKKAAKKTSGRR